MDNMVTQETLWTFLNQHNATEEIAYQTILDHFGLDAEKDTDREEIKNLQTALQKLETIGALALSGYSAPSVYLQKDLPVEIGIKFNVPKQEGKAPSIVLADRGIIERKIAGEKFKPVKLNLKTDLSIEDQRLIERANAYVWQEADGSYTAEISKVTAKRTPKEAEQSVQDQQKAKNASNKSTATVEVLNEMGIPHSFSQAALDQANQMIIDNKDPAELLEMSNRKDLRHIPFVTIDGEKTRTRDDAVYAEADKDPSNPNGHILWVAVSDVAHYIRPGSALDEEAKKRAASLYMPKMNIPMLPQELSEELFSLEAYKDRACLAYELKISADGEILDRKMHQGVMQSKAALSHSQVTNAIVGNSDKYTGPIKESLIDPLINVTKSLEKNSALRGVVDYSLAEKTSEEEYLALPHSIVRLSMQAAQQAVAKDLSSAEKAGIYRVQAAPSKVNEEAVSQLKDLGLIQEDETLEAEDITRDKLNALFTAARELDNPEEAKSAIAALMPRSKFTTNNIGHFTLAVDAYSPFTNPIRDYAHILTARRLKARFNDRAGAEAKIDYRNLEKDLERLTQAALRAKSAFQKIQDRRAGYEDDSLIAIRKAIQATNSLDNLMGEQDIETAVLKSMEIPVEFSDAVKSEIESIMATQANPEDLLNDPSREDLTDIPFVTIDGADARDFDDAVYAEADTDPNNKGGNVLWVAIADVAHYVKPGSALDLEARERGNSVYLPKKVVPMLPEEISNGLCSLRPDEHRACMAYRIQIDKKGKIIDRSIHQGVMKSRARLTYDQVMDAIEGRKDEQIEPIYDQLIVPLVRTYKTLQEASIERGAITFGLDQLSIHVVGDEERPEFREIKEDDSRSLIAESMIAANMCAASDQRSLKNGVYRVHDDPSAGNIEALEILVRLGVVSQTEFLNGIDKSPTNISRLIENAEKCSDPELAKHMIVRLQSAAKYSIDNIGHFGLQIKPEIGYSHFTSPIRRYPDLLVHRNLKDKFNLAQGMMPSELKKETASILDHCSETERRADRASNKVADAYCMRFLNKLEGQLLNAKIIRADEKGIKIRLTDLDLETIIKTDSLPDGRYRYDTKEHALMNIDTGHVFPAGYTVQVMVNGASNDNYGMPSFCVANPDFMISDKVWGYDKTAGKKANGPKSP